MMKLFKLLRRVIIHKFWVAYYCFQIGLYWQGITHDLSKFSLTEIKGALKYWNDSKSSLAYEKELNGYSATFLHHRVRNYVFDNRRVKDHRTDTCTTDVGSVMNGNIDVFL